jgi:hypothetical protein
MLAMTLIRLAMIVSSCRVIVVGQLSSGSGEAKLCHRPQIDTLKCL